MERNGDMAEVRSRSVQTVVQSRGGKLTGEGARPGLAFIPAPIGFRLSLADGGTGGGIEARGQEIQA